MKLSLRDFDLAFVGLKLGEHRFDYQLNNEFFSLFGLNDFLSSNLSATAVMIKKETSLDWHFTVSGSVRIPCDVTNEPFDLPLQNELHLVVKYGDEFDDSRDEILVIPSGDHRMNIAQYLYEISALAMPLKRVSPEGMKLQEIEDSEIIESDKADESGEIDPRWQKLKDLLS